MELLSKSDTRQVHQETLTILNMLLFYISRKNHELVNKQHKFGKLLFRGNSIEFQESTKISELWVL